MSPQDGFTNRSFIRIEQYESTLSQE